MTAREILAIMEEIVQMELPRTLVLAQMVLEEVTVKQVHLMIYIICHCNTMTRIVTIFCTFQTSMTVSLIPA